MGFTNYGLTECRMLLKGKEVIAGIKTNEVPGSTMKSKREYLHTAKVDAVRGLVDKAGFICVLDRPGQMLVVPTGHMLLASVAETACSLRWSLAGVGDDAKKVHDSVSMLLLSYPDLATTTYGAWRDHLAAEMVVGLK